MNRSPTATLLTDAFAISDRIDVEIFYRGLVKKVMRTTDGEASVVKTPVLNTASSQYRTR